MKKGMLMALTAAVVLAAAVLAVVLLAIGRNDASFAFSLRDAVSGGWVWDLTARIQDRVIRGYYQSDAGPITYRFTKLKPGKAALTLSAPGYQSLSIPVRLGRGANRLGDPVLMLGLQIPGLDHFLAFETLKGRDIEVQLRPVGSDGRAILNHPCLGLWVGARVFVEMNGVVPAVQEIPSGAARGARLFSGALSWSWDPAPESQFRYGAVIPGASMAADPHPYRVIDYLVVVPDPLSITGDELDALMSGLWAQDQADMIAALEKEKGRLRYFVDTSWNVKAAQQ